MANTPVRRSQIVAPFGVGALMTTSEGITLIMAGLDYWFQGYGSDLELTEFEIKDEWRLSAELGVTSFRIPPDFRKPFFRGDEDAKNLKMVIPAFRFPLWSFCPNRNCRRLYRQTPFESNNFRCTACQRPSSKSRNGKRTVQTSFIAMCKDGHIQDFPFSEWVHRSSQPGCNEQLSLILSGATLASQKVKCECGVSRSFDHVFSGAASSDESYLSQYLEFGKSFTCGGSMPWLADSNPSGCGNQLFGGLTGSVSNYYPHVKSSIYLPQNVGGLSQELVDAFSDNRFQQFFAAAGNLPIENILSLMENAGFSARISPLLNGVSIRTALEAYLDSRNQREQPAKAPSLKELEFDFLNQQENLESQNLATRVLDLSAYSDHSLKTLVTSITAVDKLRETRVLVGFDRLKPQADRSVAELKKLMAKPGKMKDWLPAYEVYGEGIFFAFENEKLKQWSLLSGVQGRLQALSRNERSGVIFPNDDPTLLARAVAVHTVSHLIINQMVYASGYAAASLRERIYVTPESDTAKGRNGLLIYTASGDAEGSLGGLVRLSEPGRLEVLIEAALEAARFCSSDPVCMEVGSLGQGPDSLNLAACHNCALLPETSCEYFNVFLDRGLVIGTFDSPELGLIG